MSPQDLRSRLASLRAELNRRPVDPSHQKGLEKTISELELQLAASKPLDSSVLLGSLRDWEARLVVEHPLVAEILADIGRKLEAMGI